ncbi:cell wall-associated NlpC family hydrolase [Deinococcus sp. HSC-46F16]|uniref:C40 family peptidase n=1 Tax=Deinococcus sp. HSC-46F16 TaxID=2910968 RepID=UPI00209CB3A1|nr:C40 family peptidase [Deinococcus sp. HSC-46F16]MCP2013769.1 cell wall-associated NlpC family hydrolase [Deinococcus sp. HSC-46F16]
MPAPALPASRLPAAVRATLVIATLSLSGSLPSALAATTANPPASPASPALPGSAISGGAVTVQKGDTAYSLARAHGLKVDELLALNGLSSPDLQVGQVLRVRAAAASHTVQPKETLYGISRQYGLSVDALLAANNLAPTVVLEVGQVLQIPAAGSLPAPRMLAQSLPVPPAPAQPAARPADSATGDDWRGTAMALLGVPYVYGGTSRSGLDCSGFVLQVFAPLGVELPRTSAAQARVGQPVEVADLQAGDLVFFDTVGRGEVTHVGIYLGENQFVNANSYRKQVAVDRLQGDPYWGPKLLGARRVLPPVMYGSAR